MLPERHQASALCKHQGPDAVILIGGLNGHNLHCAELLFADGSSEDETWRWQTLTSMHKTRVKPGLLLQSDNATIQQILVAGGCDQTAELLTISCKNTLDRGQWTFIRPLVNEFYDITLVCFNDRISAFSMRHFVLILSFS